MQRTAFTTGSNAHPGRCGEAHTEAALTRCFSMGCGKEAPAAGNRAAGVRVGRVRHAARGGNFP